MLLLECGSDGETKRGEQEIGSECGGLDLLL
jgi:hypothetical protein